MSFAYQHILFQNPLNSFPNFQPMWVGSQMDHPEDKMYRTLLAFGLTLILSISARAQPQMRTIPLPPGSNNRAYFWVSPAEIVTWDLLSTADSKCQKFNIDTRKCVNERPLFSGAAGFSGAPGPNGSYAWFELQEPKFNMTSRTLRLAYADNHRVRNFSLGFCTVWSRPVWYQDNPRRLLVHGWDSFGPLAVVFDTLQPESPYKIVRLPTDSSGGPGLGDCTVSVGGASEELITLIQTANGDVYISTISVASALAPYHSYKVVLPDGYKCQDCVRCGEKLVYLVRYDTKVLGAKYPDRHAEIWSSATNGSGLKCIATVPRPTIVIRESPYWGCPGCMRVCLDHSSISIKWGECLYIVKIAQ